MMIARYISLTSAVWMALIVLTMMSYLLFEGELLGAWSSIGVITVAAIKSRLVILYFMEANHAPAPWRALYETWNMGVAVMIITALFVSAGK